MKPSRRQKIYQERRSQAARQRRSLHASEESIFQEIQTSFCEKSPADQMLEDASFHDALSTITKRTYSYSAATGLLFRCDANECRIQIIAPRPMTKPMEILSLSWEEEINKICPERRWIVRVAPAPPPSLEKYECIFWRTPTLKPETPHADFLGRITAQN